MRVNVLKCYHRKYQTVKTTYFLFCEKYHIIEKTGKCIKKYLHVNTDFSYSKDEDVSSVLVLFN